MTYLADVEWACKCGQKNRAQLYHYDEHKNGEIYMNFYVPSDCHLYHFEPCVKCGDYILEDVIRQKDGLIGWEVIRKHMKPTQTIQESPFSNTYGGLSLVLGDDGQKYLEMGDCFGFDYFGPLTDEQIAAFCVLCDVQSA